MSRNLNLHLDHIVIWVADIEKTSDFLGEIVGLRRHPMEIGVSADDPTVGGMEGVFFDGNGLWLELILPTTPGPGMDILEEKGAGTVVEINFQPEEYDDILAEMKSRGIAMLNMDGSPLNEDGGLIKEGIGSGDDIEHTGQRIAYWSTALSRGTSVEIFEVRPGDEGGLINIRDKMWEKEPPAAASDPWVSHVTIICKDLQATAKFYTDVIGLESAGKPLTSNERGGARGAYKFSFINAKGVWLELIEPAGPGLMMDLLHERGDGHVGSICFQVQNLKAYCDKLKAKGVQMLNVDGEPVSDSNITHAPFGEKKAYFPASLTCGVAVEIIERGPKETSCLPNWKGRAA